MYDGFDIDVAPPAGPPAVPPAPGTPWLAGVVGGLVGALVVGAAWLGISVFGSDAEPAPTAATVAVTTPTTAAAPTTTAAAATTTTIPPTTTTAAAASDPGLVPTVAETGAAVVPTIVTVEVGATDGEAFQRSGSGSGVIIDAEAGYIVTNDHVVAAGSSSRVILSDGRSYPSVLIGTDPLTDLAVLQVAAGELSAIEWGDAASLVVGDMAIAVGSPLGLEGGPSLTVGVISAFDRQVQTGPSDVLYGMLQTDAPITNGSSGGALVDGFGRLIGITTAVGVSENGIEGIGFATPVEIVRRIVDELIAEGGVEHAFLGITGRTAFSGIDDGGSAPAGVEILSIEPGSAAEAAGLVAGDIITSVDGSPIDTMEELIPVLRRLSVGEEVEIRIDRAGAADAVMVVLGARPA